MALSIRAPNKPGFVLAAAFALLVAARTLCADTPPPATEASVPTSDSDGCVKVFDFNERPAGNYEDTPMYWTKLAGAGLPAYSAGQFDDSVGHAAPPSFRFTLRGGSIGYEYSRADLAIEPGADYVIETYIRAEGLEHARALVTCYLVDHLEQRIPGSERISGLVRSDTPGGPTWQRVEIALPGRFPTARALRLQLWVLQRYVWREPDETVVDPIVRQDVQARVWFDDIRIRRTARLNLTLSSPGGLVVPGATESFRLEAQNVAHEALSGEFRILDADGETRARTEFVVGPDATEQSEQPVPQLPPGLYDARATLGRAQQPALERSLHFAVLPLLPGPEPKRLDFGVDLGPWPDSPTAGALALLHSLGCGAVKVAVPLRDAPLTDEATAELRQIRDLARRLALDQIQATAVLLPPATADGQHGRASLCRWVSANDDWGTRVGPTLAYLGGDVSSWQLGDESQELATTDRWTASAVAGVRERLERVVAAPQLVVPRSVLDAQPAAAFLGAAEPKASREGEAPAEPNEGDVAAPLRLGPQSALSFWVPEMVPARALPWELAFWLQAQTDQSGGAVPAQSWLSIGCAPDDEPPSRQQATDLARRIVLARAVNPDRLYVPAPLECATTSGTTSWQPTAAYIPLRTLFHCLSGQRASGSFVLDLDSVAILFRGDEQSTLVVWSWEHRPAGASVELHAGASATAIDLWGTVVPLQHDGARVRVPLSPMPLIVTNVSAPLLQLRESFRVEPAVVQLHDSGPLPVLTLRNGYLTALSGTIALRPPPEWDVSPNPIPLELAPGAALEQPLHFMLPPRQVASGQQLGVDVHVVQPDVFDMHFDVRLEIELKGISLRADARWEGHDLVVEHALQNNSDRPVSFNAFCQPPDATRADGLFLNVPPGGSRTQAYRFPAAQRLAGQNLWLGIREINGTRTLDQLVAVPP